MAQEEARAMLDALMGGDRNAPLPSGAALPRSKKRRHNNNNNSEMQLQLPGKRSKSCFDPDICPLYCAWGIDVFELFVNTKSDIGPNPYAVDDGARQEFLKLPKPEQERLGFHFFLFQKLQELVRTCDRTVQRNKEKLNQELKRLAAKRANSTANQPVVDYVQDIDEGQVEALARNELELEFLQTKLAEELLPRVDELQGKEQALTEELTQLLEEQRAKDKPEEKDSKEDGDGEKEKENGDDSTAADAAADGNNNDPAVKKEEDGENVAIKKEEEQESGENGDSKEEGLEEDVKVVKKEEVAATQAEQEKNPKIQTLQTDLGRLTLEKQRLLWDTARTISQLGPLKEQIETQWRNLHYVKSDIAADKTVCEVSGNFMSARDADERIAAHYAGKQYVGWKLVREKFQEMIKEYGRYGPPPPDRSGRDMGGGLGVPGGRGPPPRGGGGGGFPGNRGGFDRGGRGGDGRGRFDDRDAWGGGRGRGGGRDRDRGRRNGSPPSRYGPGGGGYDRRGPPPRGHWRGR